jgi:hypothetical protein
MLVASAAESRDVVVSRFILMGLPKGLPIDEPSFLHAIPNTSRIANNAGINRDLFITFSEISF